MVPLPSGSMSPAQPQGAEGPLEGAGSLELETWNRPGILAQTASISSGADRLDPTEGAACRRPAALSSAGTMRLLLCALAGLGVLCASRVSAAAEPSIPSGGDSSQSTGCQRYMVAQERLEVIGETVEKTVEHLEAEVKGLLGQLEDLAWNLPPGLSSPAPDLLEDSEQLRILLSAIGGSKEPSWK